MNKKNSEYIRSQSKTKTSTHRAATLIESRCFLQLDSLEANEWVKTEKKKKKKIEPSVVCSTWLFRFKRMNRNCEKKEKNEWISLFYSTWFPRFKWISPSWEKIEKKDWIFLLRATWFMRLKRSSRSWEKKRSSLVVSVYSIV